MTSLQYVINEHHSVVHLPQSDAGGLRRKVWKAKFTITLARKRLKLLHITEVWMVEKFVTYVTQIGII